MGQEEPSGEEQAVERARRALADATRTRNRTRRLAKQAERSIERVEQTFHEIGFRPRRGDPPRDDPRH